MTATNRDPSEFFSVDIFVKDLLKFLNCHQANPAHVICCIHRDLCVVFYVYLHGGMDPNTGTEDSVLTYFLPARHSS
ncbi:hypothetical protein BC828DRAFT_408296 [Blastocladiella britannica]|nr:hypothetical protein BC828DRAFT_408296 [Blastocladiella britannica]